MVTGQVKRGRSFTTANSGATLAQAGQKALLVDADLRRPMLHRVFNVDRSKAQRASNLTFHVLRS